MRLDDCKTNFAAAVSFLKDDIATLRTGRASSAMVDSLIVEAYGSHQPLKAVASITISDAKTIMIDPWDKGLLAAVEKGIRDCGLGLNPVNDGRGIRLNLPELTSERRQELVKLLHHKLEQARIAVRKIREDARDTINTEEKNKSLSEDEKFRQQEDVEKMVKEVNEEIKTVGENKEKEINTI